MRGAHVLGLFQIDGGADATSSRGAPERQEETWPEAEERAVPKAARGVPGVQTEAEEKVADPETGWHQGLIPQHDRHRRDVAGPSQDRRLEHQDEYAVRGLRQKTGRSGGGICVWTRSQRERCPYVFRHQRQRHYTGHASVAAQRLTTRPGSAVHLSLQHNVIITIGAGFSGAAQGLQRI